MSERVAANETPADVQVALACLLIAVGGLLLGLQVDGYGQVVGTGFTQLGIGALVALVATGASVARLGTVPRRPLDAFSLACGFAGLAFLVSGVLAPGGTWMFFEVLLLFGMLTLRRSSRPVPEVGSGLVLALGVMLLFRLWISFQGSQHRWELVSLDVPVVSWIPFALFDPIRSVSLGEFTPAELGFPPSGLNFPVSMTLWSLGFVLCVVGLTWRSRAGLELENDRIHGVIHDLPPLLATMVERILPEEDWQSLGLHGLPDRLLRKRIQALVGDRLAQRREIETAIRSVRTYGSERPAGFAGEITSALERHQLPRSAEFEVEP